MKDKEETTYKLRTMLASQDSPTPKARVVHKRGAEYLSYGEDNEYPIFLNSLLENSEHNAIIHGKVDYAVGQGLDLNNLTPEQEDFFIENDINDFITKLALDYEIYGGFAFYVTRTRDMENVARIEHADFAKIRVSEENDYYLIGDDWSKYRTNTRSINPYHSDNREARTLYYYKGSTNKDVYPIPKYYGAIRAIQTGIEIDKFHLNHVENGFFIPTIFNFNNGVPTDEEQADIEQAIEEKFTGSEKAGRFLISFNDDKDTALELESFEPADLDKKFEILAEQISQKIFVGHRVTNPVLFGIKTPGQLGGRRELIDAYELFKHTYIQNTQQTILSSIEDALSLNWPDITLDIVELQPVTQQLDLTDILDYLTEDEIRQFAGLPSLDRQQDTEDELNKDTENV